MRLVMYKGGYKYQLCKTYTVKTSIIPSKRFDNGYVAIASDGTLTIRKGYAWDGPSGPAVDTRTFMRGSLVHDALYQLLREKALVSRQRRAADRLMYRLCREDGMFFIRALWCFWGVRLFARNASRKGRPVLVAP